MSEPHIRAVVNRSGRAHHLLGTETVSEPTEETKPEEPVIIQAISGGKGLPPEPTDDHHGGGPGKPPSDQTVIVVSVLYIAGGLFMIGLGVSALRAMNKRRKERNK